MHSFIEVNRELKEFHVGHICSIKEYTMYLLMPTLVYQEKYPCLDKVRGSYIIEKLLEVAVLLVYWHKQMVIIKYIESYWMSVLQSFQCNEGIENVVILYLKIAAPMILAYYCIFYFVFELYLNICAEVTRFGDRQYYMVCS